MTLRKAVFIFTSFFVFSALLGTTKALIIYVSEFDDNTISPLKYAKADAETFAKFLQIYDIVNEENIQMLKNPSLAWMKAKVKDFFNSGKNDDKLIFYYSGHGYFDNKSKKTYFIPKDTVADYLSDTAFPVEDYLEPVIKNSKAQVFLFIDACYSGSLGKDKPLRFKHFSKERFEKVAKNSQVAMLLSSGPNETSKEDEKLGHGVFTYYLLEGIKGNADLDEDLKVNFKELSMYVEKKVSEHTRNLQNPQAMFAGNIGNEIISYNYSGIEEIAFKEIKAAKDVNEDIKSVVGKVVAHSAEIDNEKERFIRRYVWKLGLGRIGMEDFVRIVQPKVKELESSPNWMPVRKEGVSLPNLLKPMSLQIGYIYNIVENAHSPYIGIDYYFFHVDGYTNQFHDYSAVDLGLFIPFLNILTIRLMYTNIISTIGFPIAPGYIPMSIDVIFTYLPIIKIGIKMGIFIPVSSVFQENVATPSNEIPTQLSTIIYIPINF